MVVKKNFTAIEKMFIVKLGFTNFLTGMPLNEFNNFNVPQCFFYLNKKAETGKNGSG
jgi:hypothetical protein